MEINMADSEVVNRKELLARIKASCKSFGVLEESVPVTWEDRPQIAIPVIPTPSARLNACIGVGGIPLGRITEVFGTESSGKTTLMLEIIAQAQKMGLPTAFIDMEHALDASYAEALGVKMGEVLISQPPTGDQALSVMKACVSSGIKLVVLDSIAALVSAAEYEKEITDNHMAVQARMLSQGLRQLSPLAGAQGCAIVFINQLREKVGVMYGNPEVTPGGRALKFYASLRLELRAQSTSGKEGDTRRTSKIKVVKNKLAPPFKNCEVDIIYGKGFDRIKDAVSYAKDLGIIQGRAWLNIPDHNNPEGDKLKFQGLDSVNAYVETTEGYLEFLMNECLKLSKEKINNGSDTGSDEDAE